MDKSLASYRVIYGDTDQMGVAYYANYIETTLTALGRPTLSFRCIAEGGIL